MKFNSLWILILQLAPQVSNLLLIGIAAWRLEAEAVGGYLFALAAISLVAEFLRGGITEYLTRSDQIDISMAALCRLYRWLGVLALAVALPCVIAGELSDAVAVALLPVVLMQPCAGFLEGFYLRARKAKFFSAVITTSSVAGAVFGLAAVFAGFGVISLAVSVLLRFALTLIAGFWGIRRHAEAEGGAEETAVDSESWKRFAAFYGRFLVVRGFNVVNQQFLNVALGIFVGPVEVATFNLAKRPLDLVNSTLHTALQKSSLVQISGVTDENAYTMLKQKGWSYLKLYSLVIPFAAAIGWLFMDRVFGDKYAGVAALTVIFILFAFVQVQVYIINTIFIKLGGFRELYIWQGYHVAATIPICYLMMQGTGLIVVSIAYVVKGFLGLLLGGYLLGSRIRERDIRRSDQGRRLELLSGALGVGLSICLFVYSLNVGYLFAVYLLSVLGFWIYTKRSINVADCL